MNLKTYYQKIHEIESSIVQPFVVLVSHDTSDGGREGLLTEAPKELAAKMIVDGRAHLANDDAAREFHEKKAEAKRIAETAGRSPAIPVPATDLAKGRRVTKE